MLATQGWEKIRNENASMDALCRSVGQFEIPLLKLFAKTYEILTEFTATVEYAVQFISVATFE